jgi:type IV pilus assembly protein PilA
MRTKDIRRTDGFTLVELLVVIGIIGILAAIAIPAFLGQRQKAMDADAKSQARNLVSIMEACYRRDEGYNGCWAEAQAPGSGLPFGSAPGQVRIDLEEHQGYRVVAVSNAETGGTNHVYVITENIAGVSGKGCTPAGQGGCGDDGSW